jgi:type VII secretion protein EssB
MKISNGADTVDLERDADTIVVRLTSAQFDVHSLDTITQYMNMELGDDHEFAARVTCAVPPESISLTQAAHQASTPVQRLRLAQQVLSCAANAEHKFVLAFLHPQNIYIVGGSAILAYHGLLHLVTPQTCTDDQYLSQVKALVLSVFHPDTVFSELTVAAGAVQDDLSSKVLACTSLAELRDFIDARLVEAIRDQRSSKSLVNKKAMIATVAVSVVAVLLSLVFGWCTFRAYSTTIPLQEAVISAHEDFLNQSYDQTQHDLQAYAPSQLPKSARYILAASAVNLADLTTTQKQTLLRTLSPKTDDNTLNYWVYTGRGDFAHALNLAQNLGDDQLTLLAYINQYQVAKLDGSMDGATKQKTLSDLEKKINDLTAKVSGSKDSSAQ